MGCFEMLLLFVPWLFVLSGLVLLAIGASWAQFTDSENANLVAVFIGVLLFLCGIGMCCLEEAHRAEDHTGVDGDDEEDEAPPPKLAAPAPKAPAPKAPAPKAALPPVTLTAGTGSKVRWFRV